MREIEFRGKCPFGWVYGCLNYDASKNTLIRAEDFTSALYVVNPETVGQYTGLKDKNGNKIFEGDILKLKELNYNYEWTAVVEFGNPNSEYVWGWNLKPITKYIGWSLDILCWVEMPVGSSCEVIGNIFDSPELLEEK